MHLCNPKRGGLQSRGRKTQHFAKTNIISPDWPKMSSHHGFSCEFRKPMSRAKYACMQMYLRICSCHSELRFGEKYRRSICLTGGGRKPKNSCFYVPKHFRTNCFTVEIFPPPLPLLHPESLLWTCPTNETTRRRNKVRNPKTFPNLHFLSFFESVQARNMNELVIITMWLHLGTSLGVRRRFCVLLDRY